MGIVIAGILATFSAKKTNVLFVLNFKINYSGKIISKLTDAELETALTEAAFMRGNDCFPKFIAQALLSMHYRLGYLDSVPKLAECYVNFGREETQHQALIKAIELASYEGRRFANVDELTALAL